ncbi:MAG: hypothetical protein II295_07485 [Akkermansia sp.]|nr:hypothetical protein [Akkermansia sp.]
MFAAVIAGYLVSALFVFCGLVNTCIFISNIEQDMGVQAAMSGLCISAWPIAVATAIFLLTQIAVQLERMGILSTAQAEIPELPTSQKTDATPQRFSTMPPLPTGSYFRADTPVVEPKAPTRTPAPEPEAQAPSIEELSDIVTAAAAEAANEEATPSEAIPPVIKRNENGLNFFRID